MALIKRRNKYYARIRWYLTNGKQEEIQIPLKTSLLTAARERLKSVINEEANIKDGITQSFEFKSKFRWLNPEGTSKYKSLTLGDIIPEYLKHLRRYGRTENTISRRQQCLNKLQIALKPTFPAKSLNSSSIAKFIDFHKGKLANSGINMHLAHIRSLTNWLYDEKDMLPKRIKFKLIKVDAKPPSYLTEQNIIAIMQLTEISEHCKDAFQFYYETGLRLREPYHGTIKNGNWLIIPKTKNRKGKRIQLAPHLIPVWNAMMDRFNNSKAIYKSKSGYYSRQFKKAVRLIGRGELHFHNLRDTFAIIRYIQTRDIYQVSNELHHSSVTTTEKYAIFYSMEELESDFPSLVVNMPNFQGEVAPDSKIPISPLTPLIIENKNIRGTVIRGTQECLSS